jgi:uroporphyrinogen decarboxylase
MIYSNLDTQKPMLSAVIGQKPKVCPIWLMRQAGRYLPEYMSVREKHDTLTMFSTPKIAAEITMQPLRRFDLNAAILYADILLIPHAAGMGLSFVKGEGPVFSRTVRNEDELNFFLKSTENLEKTIEKTNYISETLSLVKPQLSPSVALIGFAGAPWTVASYLMEGGSAHGEFTWSKKILHQKPKIISALLDRIADLTIHYLNMQINAGVEIVQLFESWSGALSPSDYKEHILPSTQKIISAVRSKCPVIHFLGEGGGLVHLVSENEKLSPQVFGVDWRQDLKQVSKALPSLCLQGNLDPSVCNAPPEKIKTRVHEIMAVGRNHPGGFIFNVGHGLRPGTSVEGVQCVIDSVREFVG